MATVRLEGLGQLKKSNDLIGIRYCDLPACSIVPQPTTLPWYQKIYKIFSVRSEKQYAVKPLIIITSNYKESCLNWNYQCNFYIARGGREDGRILAGRRKRNPIHAAGRQDVGIRPLPGTLKISSEAV
jgi:hypothetical protein